MNDCKHEQVNEYGRCTSCGRQVQPTRQHVDRVLQELQDWLNSLSPEERARIKERRSHRQQ